MNVKQQHTQDHCRASGFTLIELLIVVIIVAVLAAVAIPTYKNVIVKSRRGDAKIALAEMANLQEKFYSANLRYTGAVASLPYVTTSTEGYYSLSIPVATTVPSFTVRATAIGVQATDDTSCAVFELTSTGVRTPADCW